MCVCVCMCVSVQFATFTPFIEKEQARQNTGMKLSNKIPSTP